MDLSLFKTKPPSIWKAKCRFQWQHFTTNNLSSSAWFVTISQHMPRKAFHLFEMSAHHHLAIEKLSKFLEELFSPQARLESKPFRARVLRQRTEVHWSHDLCACWWIGIFFYKGKMICYDWWYFSYHMDGRMLELSKFTLFFF